MLTLLVLLQYLFARHHHGVQALPIPANDITSEHCNDLQHCRTIWNIIWSCLATLFACTWTAVHPNIPSPDDTWVVIAFRRFKIVLLALIAPEFVIVWAIRQRLVGRGIAKDLQGVLCFSHSLRYVLFMSFTFRREMDRNSRCFRLYGRIHAL